MTLLINNTLFSVDCKQQTQQPACKSGIRFIETIIQASHIKNSKLLACHYIDTFCKASRTLVES